jgi:uncharacterized membrane protein YtjA (UPF0391 family)
MYWAVAAVASMRYTKSFPELHKFLYRSFYGNRYSDAVTDLKSRLRRQGGNMLYYALMFFIIALVAAFFGFFGVATAAAGIAKILFYIFLIVFLVTLVMGLGRRGTSV